MSAEVEATALGAGSGGGEKEEPLAARLVECALSDAMAQMADRTEQEEAEAEEARCAEPLAEKLVVDAVEEAVDEVGRRFLTEERETTTLVTPDTTEAFIGGGDSKEIEKPEAVIEEKAEKAEEDVDEKKEMDPCMDILGNGLLRKKTLVPGKGRDTRPLHGDSVTVSFTTFLADSGEKISHEETTFVVGDGDVVQALDLAVALSELQEQFELISDARFAYGKKGLPPRIPPDASLRFDVHLLRCDEPPAYAAMTSEQRLTCANQKRERGNFLYEREEYALSINSYNKALEILNSGRRPSATPSDPTESSADSEARPEEVRETKIKIYNNMAAAQIRIEAFDAAVQSCDEVLKLSPDNVKALFRRGKAKVGTGDLADAVRCLRSALRLDPESRIVQTELNRVLALVKRERESQQKLYRRMFNSGAPCGETEPSADASPALHSWRRYLWYGAGVAMVGVSVALASAAIKYHQQHS